MSVLSFPRIALNGSVSWNPATQNNSIAFGYDKNDVDLQLSKLTFKNGDPVTLTNFTQWLIELNSAGQTNGDWNVFGQHQVNFDVNVSTAIPGFQQTDSSDPVLKDGILRFTGGSPKLVDVDAYSSQTSQVFLSDFAIQAADNVGFRGKAEARMTSRRIFAPRNMYTYKRPDEQKPGFLPIAGLMGVVWQTTIAGDNIIWGSDAGASTTLSAMKTAIDGGQAQGVMLRMVTYTTLYFSDVLGDQGWIDETTADVYGKLADNYAKVQPVNVGNITSVLNPAKSTALGAVGLWGNDELATVPMNRVLSPAVSDLPLGASSALVNADQGCVSVDLMNTIPAKDPGNDLVDTGTLTVTATPSGGGTPVTLGTADSSDYALSALNAAGGVIDVKADLSAFTDDMALGVTFSKVKSSLSELVLAAEADNRSIYIDEGASGTAHVTVTKNGAPIPAGQTSDYAVLAVMVPTDYTPAQGFDPAVPGAQITMTGGTSEGTNMMSYPLGSDCTVTIDMDAVKEGNSMVYFIAYLVSAGVPDQATIQAMQASPAGGYAAVRVMPVDAQFESVAGDDLTWEYVYENALMPFDLTYRGMSCGVFSLGSKSQVLQHAETIAAFTAPGYFESPMYMPVTRDLSSGRRALIVNYLVKEGVLPAQDPLVG